MQRSRLTDIKKNLILNFAAILFINPFINSFFVISRVTKASQFKEIAVILCFALTIWAASILAYSFLAGKLQSIISSDDRSAESIRFAKRMNFRASLIFCLPMLSVQCLCRLSAISPER
jgi:hypothetical protein